MLSGFWLVTSTSKRCWTLELELSPPKRFTVLLFSRRYIKTPRNYVYDIMMSTKMYFEYAIITIYILYIIYISV